jgi:hypothetical protein
MSEDKPWALPTQMPKTDAEWQALADEVARKIQAGELQAPSSSHYSKMPRLTAYRPLTEGADQIERAVLGDLRERLAAEAASEQPSPYSAMPKREPKAPIYEAKVASILVDGKPIVLTGELDGVTLVEPQDPGPRSVRYVGCSPHTVSMSVTLNDEATPALNRILRAWRMVHPWRHEWAPPSRKPSPKQKRKAKRQAQRKARRKQR